MAPRRPRRRRTVAPVLALALAACGDARPDVLLVTVDTLRRDAVSVYGFPYARTPEMDAVGRAGAVFEDHHTVTGLTGPSHATLFSGLHPRQHGVRRNGVELPASLVLVPEVLAAAGYETAAAVGAGVVGSEFGFGRGFAAFDERFDVGDYDRAGERSGPYERLGEDVVDAALGLLADATGEAPLFLWVHLFDPHLPHLRPAEERPLLADLLEEGCVLAEPNAFQDAQHLARLRRGYTAEVRYTDRQLGRLLGAWDARGSGRGEVVVVTSDHGEGLGEHSYIGHSFYLYREQMRVPLLVRAPGRVAPGSRASAVTSSVDLAATLLDLAGVEQPRAVGGASLLPRLGAGVDPDATAFAERPPLADAMRRMRTGEEPPEDPGTLQGRLAAAREGRAGGGELGLVAVVRGSWKYVWSEDAPDELFDRGRDPLERESLGEDHPRAETLRLHVERWMAALRRLHDPPGGEASRVEHREAMLDALGY